MSNASGPINECKSTASNQTNLIFPVSLDPAPVTPAPVPPAPAPVAQEPAPSSAPAATAQEAAPSPPPSPAPPAAQKAAAPPAPAPTAPPAPIPAPDAGQQAASPPAPAPSPETPSAPPIVAQESPPPPAPAPFAEAPLPQPAPGREAPPPPPPAPAPLAEAPLPQPAPGREAPEVQGEYAPKSLAQLVGAWAYSVEDCERLLRRRGGGWAYRQPVDKFAQAAIVESPKRILLPSAACRVERASEAKGALKVQAECADSISYTSRSLMIGLRSATELVYSPSGDPALATTLKKCAP